MTMIEAVHNQLLKSITCDPVQVEGKDTGEAVLWVRASLE